MFDWPEPGLDSRFVGLGIALGLGLLIGLEREWVENKPVGLRSFGLIGLFGGLTAAFIEDIGPWPVVAGLLALGALLVLRGRAAKQAGMTTLVAGLIVFMVGAAATAGYWLHAIVTAGVVTLLLHWKRPMHRTVERLGRADLETIARFVLISLVVLPVLPNESFGPYEVFNPFKAWLLVVLIVSINLAGYVAIRFAGANAGGWLAGLIGGMVSSTATTFSYSRIARRAESLGLVAALVILIASTVVYLRILFEVSVVAPGLLPVIIWPCSAFAAVLLVCCGAIFLKVQHRTSTEIPKRSNPAEMKTALTFAAIYVAVLFAAAAAQDWIGENAAFGVAFISGLTDVDALTLSMAQLFDDGRIGSDIAWRAIFLGSLSNLLFKIGIVSVSGSRTLRIAMIAAGVPAILVGAGILVLWP